MHIVNRFDYLQVTTGSFNNTCVAKATNLGQTIIKVSLIKLH